MIIQTPHRGMRSRYDTAVFEGRKLKNGATVWVQRSPILVSEEGVLVAYFSNVGNALDPQGKEGLAHFLEHMPFKGTERYPTKEAIDATVRNAGGGWNATTSRYWTNYYVALPREAFAIAADVLADVVQRPLMRPEDFEIERGVIHSERTRKFENGANLAAHDTDQLLYGDHPAFSWGIGSAESLNALSLDDVLSFWREHYHAGNLHLVVGGTFSEEPDLIEKLEAAFGGMPAKSPLALQLPPMPAVPPGRHQLRNPRYGRSRVYAGWVVQGEVSDADRTALGLLASAFSDGQDSPLIQELRDRRGLVYESGLMSTSYARDLGGSVDLDLPISGAQFDEVRSVILGLLREMPEERLATTLDRWQLLRAMGFHGPTGMCLQVGRDIVRYGHPKTIHEQQAEVDDADLDLVRKWRNHILENEPVVVETIPE